MNHQGFLKRFGTNIHELRIKKGWTRKELAVHSGLSTELITLVERGRAHISLKIILQLMEGLGYTDNELLTTNL